MTAYLEMKTISYETASRIVREALAHAARIGVPAAVAVCDPGGHLVAFGRADGTMTSAIEVAISKATTAASFGMPTDKLHDFIASDDHLRLALPHAEKVLLVGGGYPVSTGDATIGAVGVSGGYFKQDMEVARKGIDAALAGASA
jgi:uncharacterized protein GlcG (DUF336 family)